LLTAVFALLTAVVLLGFYKLNAFPGNPVSNLKAGGTLAQLASAEKFAHFCEGCHSTAGTFPLDGYKGNFFEGGPPIGVVNPPNLTPGGPLKDWSDGEIIRAIREGVHKNGRPLLVMSSDIFHNLSDAEVSALVAFLRSQPAVKHNTPETALNAVGAFFIGAGLFAPSAQPPIVQPVVAPPRAVTVEYGKYLVSITGCQTCHGSDLAGGTPGGIGTPPGPNLTVLVPQWDTTTFIKMLRNGVDPAGKTLNPREMPYKEISAAYDDKQLSAIYAFLHSLPPIIRRPK
jgi:cytochrome c553